MFDGYKYCSSHQTTKNTDSRLYSHKKSFLQQQYYSKTLFYTPPQKPIIKTLFSKFALCPN